MAHASKVVGPLLVAAFDLTESVAGFYDRTRSPWGDGVAYHHIPCLDGGAGRDDPPTEDAWHAFAIAMDSASPGPYRRVAVHCKHGHNRTGFMLVRWATSSGAFECVRDALDAFCRARPPGIYKVEYVQKLFYVFGAPPPARMPDLPPWRSSQLKLLRIPAFWLATFTDRRPPALPPLAGVPTEKTLVGNFVKPCRQVLEWGGQCASVVRATAARACGCDLREFGGNQPLAFSRSSLPLVKEHDFLITWKVDGIRVIIVVLWFGTFLVNRRAEVRHIGDLLQGSSSELRRAACPMVADGELVEGGDLWLHDLMMAGGRKLASKPLQRRLRLLRSWAERMPSACSIPGQGSIRVCVKRWWPCAMVRRVMEDPRHTPCDGAILWKKDAKYVAGRDPMLLKWKARPTIDFWVSPLFDLRLCDGRPPDVGVLLNREPEWVNSVVECEWSKEPPGWVALFKRKDKPRGNARDVYDDTFPIIQDPVGTDEIEEAAKR